LVKVKLGPDASLPQSVEDVGEVLTSNNNTKAEIVDTRDEGISSGDTIEFTPSESGQYIFAVVQVDNGSKEGLVDADTAGNLRASSDVTIVGFDQFLVQSNRSDISTPETAAIGNTVEVEADASSLDSDTVSHTAVILNESTLSSQTQVINVDLDSGEIQSIETEIASIKGATDIQSGTSLAGSTLPSSRFQGSTDIVSLLTRLVGSTEDVQEVDDTVIYTSQNGTVGDPQETIRIRTTENFTPGEYSVIHFATEQNGTTTVSSKDTLQIEEGTQLNLTANNTGPVLGTPVSFTVTNANDEPVTNANITYNGQTYSTGDSNQVTFTPEESGTATVTKDPVDGTPFVSDSVEIEVLTPQFEVTNVNYSAAELTTRDSLVVNATVQETAGISGDFTFRLTQNGTEVDNTTVTVPAEGTATTSFQRTFNAAGDYALAVNGVNETTVTVTGFPNITYSDLAVTQSGNLNETVTVSATVVNEGEGPGEYSAPLIRDGNILAYQNGSLEAGGQTTVTFTRTFTTGTYDVTIDGLPAETITVDEPDVTYSDFSVEPTDPAFGDVVTANVTVESNDDRSVNVSLVVNGNVTDEQSVNLINDTPEEVSFPIDTRDIGLGDSSVTILGVTAEETVSVTAADLIGEITNTPTDVREGVVPVEATVTNVGNAEATDAQVVLEARPEGGSYSELTNRSVTLGPDGSTAVTANLTRDEARNYTVRVRADATDQYIEPDEDNNNATQDIIGGPLVVGTINNASGDPAANDLVLSYTRSDGNQTNVTVTEIRDDGQFLVPVNTSGPQYIAYAQTDEEEAESGNVTFPRDGSPDGYALASFSSVSDVRSIGTVELPSAGVLNVTVIDQSGDQVEDARVTLTHRNNDSAVDFRTNSTADGSIVLGDGGLAGVELNGTTNVTVRPPVDGDEYADEVYRRNLTINDTGEDITVQLIEGPDLTPTLDIARTQRFGDGVTANVSVSNNGLRAVENATVELRVRKSAAAGQNTTLTKYTGNLATRQDAANNTTTLQFDFTEFAENNLLGDRADGNARVTAVVDPAGAISESVEGNNRAVNSTVVRYEDPAVQVFAPARTIEREQTPISVFVKNNGTAPIEDATVDLDYGDGSNTTVNLGTINASEVNATETNNTYTAGEYTITANASDAVPFENNASQSITVQEFNLSLTEENITVPDEVSNGTTFTAVAEFDANYSTSVNATIELSDGLELNGSQTAEKPIQATTDGGVATWVLRTNTTNDVDGADVNVTVEALDTSAGANRSLNLTVPKLRLTDSNSTQFTPSGTATSKTLALNASDAQTFTHTLNVSVQASTDGRTLQGLEYLFFYPYGCVEQTTSQMMSALRTDQYYRTGGDVPDSYDRQRANDTIEGAMQKLGDENPDDFYWNLNQNEDGSWSMYGGTYQSSGDPYYTTVALQGVSEVANDEIQSNRTEVATALGTINKNKTITWLANEQQASNGAFPTNGYFLQERYSATGFTMVAIDRASPGLNDSASTTANESLVSAAEYLIETQNDDGSWEGEDSNSQSTALALRGLAVINESADLRQQVNQNTDTDVSTAIDDGVGWLVRNQNDDGSWEPYQSYYWWSSLGEQTRATGHAMLALYETKGLEVGNNATVRNGTNYLVGVYDDDGSFGNTRATGVAIDALTTVGQRGSAAQTVNVTISGTTKTVEVNSSSPTGTISFSQAELSEFRNSTGETGTVTIDVDNETALTGIGIDTVQVVDASEEEDAN
jgi:hypothetical protein